MLYLYTDGSSTGRANREWGWGWVLIDETGAIKDTDFGGGPCGTNNVAELQAAIEGLAYVFENYRKEPVTLVADSLYVLKTASGEYTPRKNIDQCKALRSLYLFLKSEQNWVRGHSGNKWNEMADKLSKRGKALHAKV